MYFIRYISLRFVTKQIVTYRRHCDNGIFYRLLPGDLEGVNKPSRFEVSSLTPMTIFDVYGKFPRSCALGIFFYRKGVSVHWSVRLPEGIYLFTQLW